MLDKAEQGRLRWQCRRGIKEVEVILLPYLEKHFYQSCEREKELFERLLESQDADLFEWFTDRALPSDPELTEIVGLVLGKLAP